MNRGGLSFTSIRPRMGFNSDVIIIGGAFDFNYGNASTNLARSILKGFEANGFSGELFGINYQCSTCTPRGVGLYNEVLVRVSPTAYCFPRIGGASRVRTLISLVALRQALRKERPKLVLCMTMSPIAAEYIARVCCRFGIPSAFFLVEEPRSVGRMLAKGGVIGTRGVIANERRSDRWYRRTLPLFERVLCITEPLVEKSVAEGVPQSKVRYLGHCLSLEDIKPSGVESPSGDGRLRIAYTGRINLERDDFSTLLLALRICHSQGYEVCLDILGEGPKAHIAAIQEQICLLGLSESVKYHGFLEREKLETIRAQADLFVVLKTDIEQNQYNFPTKLLEYLNEAKPVIVTRIKSHLTSFAAGEVIFVEVGDCEGLALAIAKVIQEPEYAREVGRSGRARLRASYNAQARVRQIIDDFGLRACSPQSRCSVGFSPLGTTD